LAALNHTALLWTGLLESAQFGASAEFTSSAPIRQSGLAASAFLEVTPPFGISEGFTASNDCSGSVAFFITEPGGSAQTVRPPVSAVFSLSALHEDDKQKTSPSLKFGLFVGIAAGAILLVLLAAFLIWRLVRRSVDLVTSLLSEETGMNALEPTDDIDFGAMTYDMNAVEEVAVGIHSVEPDETLTSVKSLIDEFL
jgi:hypothetical protein